MPPAATLDPRKDVVVAWNNATTADMDAVPSNEFIIHAEIWSPGSKSTGALTFRSKVSSTALRKKASEKPTSAHDDGRKLKERSSWLSGSGKGAGHWRSVTCKLIEEDDHATLNIIFEDSVVYSILIHTMHTTEVRLADRSLFNRPDCLGLHCKPGNGSTTSGFLSPLYIAFPSTDAVNAWTALLRSYTVPEIYGRRVASAQGGLYRMWRQVELQIIQGRNLGTARLVDSPSSPTTYSPDDGQPDGSRDEMDLFCEIVLDNDHPAARTSVKRAGGEPFWHESFTFGDLPPFGALFVNIWREKRSLAAAIGVGSPQLPSSGLGAAPATNVGGSAAIFGGVEIALANFRRGEWVEGWFPVLLGGAAANGIQVGEIKMKVRIDEEIVLPAEAYGPLLASLSQRNYLDVLYDLEKKLKVEQVSNQIIPLAVASNVLLTDIFALADREVDGSSAHHTLFRGNSVLTKTMELAMSWYGKQFLDRSIGNVVRRMCAERVAIEVDPVRLGIPAAGGGIGPGGGTGRLKDLEANVQLLVKWCQEFWSDIWKVRGECPNELRKLFEHIRKLVEARYSADYPELRWQCVSAFCFLRFIVPAILHPHLFGLCQGLPPPPVQRSLTLVAKVIQSLANLNANVQKEEFMRGVKDFVVHNLAAMIDYIVVVSNPVPDQYVAGPQGLEPRERTHIHDSLRERLPTLLLLARESVPLLPYLLDVPKHLATLSSAVVRSQRRPSSDEPALKELVKLCYDVEARALQCVTRLAQRPTLSISPPGARPGSGNALSAGGTRRSHRQRSAPAQQQQYGSGPEPPLPGQASRDSSATPPTSPTVFFARQGANDPDDHSPGPPPVERRKGKSKRPSTAPSTTSGGVSDGFSRPAPVKVAQSPVVGRPKPLPERPPSAPGGSVRAFGRSETDLRLRTPMPDKGPASARYDTMRFDPRREAGLYGDERRPAFDYSSHGSSGGSRGGSRDLKDLLTPTGNQGEKRKGFFRGLLNRR
ncbi:Rho GTPase activation protein [Auricularia subglabra TFB-10046 SS5]|nr:Rho GTPase activation protein [Auricularia subglabra TFB-10046 SS5]